MLVVRAEIGDLRQDLAQADPFRQARSEALWMVGPSAIGSEKGTPSSMMSAPARTSACSSGTVSAGSGSPAVMNGDQRLSPLRLQALEYGLYSCHGQNLMPDFSATVCMSLSPRPERLTSSSLSFARVGASLAA